MSFSKKQKPILALSVKFYTINGIRDNNDGILFYLAIQQYYELNHVPLKFVCWSHNPIVTIFADRLYKEVIEVEWCPKDKVLIYYGFCPYKERERHQECMRLEKRAVCKSESASRITSWYSEVEPAASRMLRKCTASQAVVCCCSSLCWWRTKASIDIFSQVILISSK